MAPISNSLADQAVTTDVRPLFVTLVLLTAALCFGLWSYLQRKRGETRQPKTRASSGSSWPSSSESQELERDRDLSQNRLTSQTELRTEFTDTNGPTPTLVKPEFTTLESAEETPPIGDAAQELTDQPSTCDSQPPTEAIPKGTETSPQSDHPFETQIESPISKTSRDLDSVPHQDTSTDLASDSAVLPSVFKWPTATTDPIAQFSATVETDEQVGESDATRTQLDEPVGSLEVPANDVELPIELSDLTGQDATSIANEQTRRVPAYRPLAPVAATAPTHARRSITVPSSPTNTADLGLRLHLRFGRAGDVNLNLVADRREHMPDEVEVSLTQGKLLLTRHQENCYEPVSLLEANSALHDGLEWRGRSGSSQFRWILSRRKLLVLAEGDVSGLYPFGSTARLQLNARHVVLAALPLRDDVQAALSEVGCTTLEMFDETTPGVPTGWLLFRNVIPTHPVPMRDGADILNALCPLPDVEPHFVGGIHLERDTWLFGYPPQIRLTGDLNDVEIKLDGQPVIVGSDGSVSAPEWDAEGDHQLWFGGQTQTYTLRTIEERWERWPAIDFGMGATICGASIDSSYGKRGSHQVIVPATNPLLIGPKPGDVYYCHRRNDLRLQCYLTCVPFQPVWALPSDPAHADRGSARLLLLRAVAPALPANRKILNQSRRPEMQRWVSVLNSASKKRLRIEPDNEDSAALWLRYRVAAKQLRRSLR